MGCIPFMCQIRNFYKTKADKYDCTKFKLIYAPKYLKLIVNTN